jgi:bifunctional DNA-binding transcriptional regulator/antitoxin component of YhaV-PrlF toxin-antitoxin module
MTSTVTVRGQTAIPASIRRRYHIVPHARIEWIDDGTSIAVVPVGSDPIASLKGKFRGMKLTAALSRMRAEERNRG